MRISDTLRLLFAAILAAAFVFGCGGSDQSESDTEPVESSEELTFEQQIEIELNDVLDRTRYQDKSGLWEHEFEYLHDEMTFDEYVGNGRVAMANTDTVEHLEVKRITRYEPDSAVAEVVVYFRGYSGKQTGLDDEITIYRQGDRWIKPTLSTYEKQAAYDSLIQQAIEAAEQEAGN